MNQRTGYIIKHSLLAMLSHAKITSGYYHLEDSIKSESGKLCEEIDKMERHIDIVSEAVDGLPLSDKDFDLIRKQRV